MLSLRSEDCEDLGRWVTDGRYLSHDIVNEQITIMGQSLLRCLLKRIHEAKWFSILADEVRDVSNHEQLGISIRWVDESLAVLHRGVLTPCFNRVVKPQGGKRW